MTKKEINNILKSESGIILLEKESEQSFFESILNNTVSLISAIYFLTRKKLDSLILTEKRILLIVQNKIQLEKKLNGNESLIYNGVKSALEITDQNEKSIIGLNKLRVSYEEGKSIRQKLTEFESRTE
ncbi:MULTISPECIES: hypothetical protein [Flavobacteriaceae]|uniref:Uncharacterized protein n=1 Tax=Maribacter ulvicola TaxID=228959 RepID=A0A1N7AXB0_9FLAO|nr:MULTISPECIES: hypothetical protein [Flavobacteriaceae]SIR43704.1 hypothetical protein SAMN05421797_1191 [Maribacter ulvicola]